MAIPDPFDRAPHSGDAQGAQPAAAPEPSSAQPLPASKRLIPRTFFKGLATYAVPVGLFAFLIWVMLPDSLKVRPKVELPPPQAFDAAAEKRVTEAMIAALKTSANAESQPKPVPDSAPEKPVPPRPTDTADPVEDARKAAELVRAKRVEEVRAAPTEAIDPVQLAGEGAAGLNKKSPLSEFEQELANLEQKKAAAGANETNPVALLNTLAGLTPPGAPVPPQSKGVHLDFVAEQSGVTPLPPPLLQQVPPTVPVVLQGTFIQCLSYSMLSSELPGLFKAMVVDDVYDSVFQRHVLIPKGTWMYGVYSTSVTPGQKRQLVAMQRMILPNGASVSLAGATASDLLGQSGIAAEVDNHFFETFSSSFVLGAASLLLPNGQSTVSTSNNAAGSVTTGSVAGLALNESLRTLLERNRRIDRTLTTDSATPFLLVVARDMALPPYRK